MATDPLRVLVVGAQFPFPPRSGFETRFYQLLRQLARRHDVTLLTYATQDDLDDAAVLRREFPVETVLRRPPSRLAKRRGQLASIPSRVPFAAREVRSAEMQRAIERLTSTQPFDAVQLESVFLWGYRIPRQLRVVLDEHNVEYEVYARMAEIEVSRVRSAYYRLEERRVRTFEQTAWRKASACVVTSPREEAIVRTHAPETPIAVVPNAVDVEYFRPSGVASAAETIVFNGVLDYWPNVDAVTFLVEEVLPRIVALRPNVTLEIVGRGDLHALERLRRPNVVLRGEVPDIRPHLEGAAVVLVPIRMGGGTRLKVVEALALARPVVSTSLGCEGIAVRDGEHLLVRDAPDAFASAVVQLLEDAELGRALGAAGRALMEREYSWDAAGDRLEELYARTTGER